MAARDEHAQIAFGIDAAAPISAGAVSGPISAGAVSGPISIEPAASGPISAGAVSGPISIEPAASGPVSIASAGDPASADRTSGATSAEGFRAPPPQEWLLELTLPFLAQLQKLHARDARYVREQMVTLARDPMLDGRRKRRVARLSAVNQLSAGEHRVFYRCERAAGRVVVLAVHRRGDRGYYDLIMGEGPPAPDSWLPARRALMDRLAALLGLEAAGTLDAADVAELRALRGAFPDPAA